MRAWFKINSFILIFLTISRLIFAATFFKLFDLSDLPLSFLTGLRFDLMVLGFLNLPVVFFLGIRWLQKFWIYYYLLVVWFILILTAIDWAYFDQNLDRINKILIMPELNWRYVLTATVLSLICLKISKMMWRARKLNQAFSWKQVFVAVFIVLLCTRGSLGSFHLDLRNSEFSENKFNNILSINSPYAWDQALRGRR
jgi:hypothetical protein